MNNKNLIHKSQDKSIFVGKTSPFSSSKSSDLNNNTGKVPFNVFGYSLKNTGYISSTNIWNNSVYSFNQNYIKNIPSVDNIVNKMIKSFFTINALDNNMEGKKSKLIQRRYKRLSLNKILVSKSEIKHSNNKVSITIFLFNKKKRSLLLSLSELYNSLSSNLAGDRSWKNRNNFEKLVSNFIESRPVKSETKSGFISKPVGYLISSQNGQGKAKPVSSIKASTYLNQEFNSKKVFKGFPLNKYAYMTTNSELMSRKPNFLKEMGLQNSGNANLYFINKILYYKRLNNLTKYNLYKFINYLGLGLAFKGKNQIYLNNIETIPYIRILKEFFVYANKYKLYNKTTYNEKPSLPLLENLAGSLGLSSKIGLELGKGSYPAFRNSFLKNPNYSISKLKSLYKLFALYNNINLDTSYTTNNLSLGLKNNFKACITNKIILNTSKLLKKTSSKELTINGLPSTKLSALTTKLLSEKRKIGQTPHSFKGKGNTASLILANKLNRIDRFLEKYKNTLSLVTSNITLKASPNDPIISQKLASNYKINFINDILEKELLYIHYLKLLSYNNAVFKNWFLFSLKNLIAKLYNKKVVFNLVNLKYIHLNSDILSQAVNIRLRNFRKNKVVDVLKKAVKLVSISKVNVYACDEHSSMYKYIHNYYDKFKHLKLDIFKELGYLDTNKSNMVSIPTQGKEQNLNSNIVDHTYTPCTIRRLNHIQTSTVNFIKFKSVFGVRLEAAGRLTKRSTASRAVFKFRYKGTLKNNPTINNSLSSAMVKNHQISNLQFTKISSKTRNGSFGLKGWINSN